MHTRRITTSAAAAALALLASACSDRLTAPAAHPAASALATSASGPTLIPNAVRYRDTGGKPATGRSGSAAVDALALLGSDGQTQLELHARAADPASDAQGSVSRVQVKAFASEGALLFTRSAAGGEPLRFGGLIRGNRVQVQANVEGIDPHRQDVVTVEQTVRLRPDLQVQTTLSDHTDTMVAGTPLVVMGEVSEMNGDLGAEADCVLLVDGQPVDQARRIWVNAGDRVNCFFTTPALAAGTHQLTVRVDGVAPGDWDLENNASTVQVVAVTASPPMWYSVDVRSETYTLKHVSSSTTYSAPYWTESRSETSESGNKQSVVASGWIGRGFAAPLTVQLVETSGGGQLQADEWIVPNFGSPLVCTNRWNVQAGTSLYFCSFFGIQSNWQFLRTSGTVTYHSLNFSRQWDGSTGEEFYGYHWENTRTTTTGSPLTGHYGLTLRFVSGTDELAVPVRVDLTPFQVDIVQPEYCDQSGDEAWGWLYRTCQGEEFHSVGERGYGYASFP